MRPTGKRRSLPATGNDGSAPMSITYLALRRSSFMGMSGAGEPQVYDGSARGKRGEDGSGRDRASQRKRHHAVASTLLGEGERLVGAREQSVDALGTLVEARGNADAHGERNLVPADFQRLGFDRLADAAGHHDGAR